MITILLIFIIFIIGVFYTFYYDPINHIVLIDDKINLTKPEKIIPKVVVTFKGSKYDISNFVRKHPGGKTILLDNNGKDVEQLMLENEHSDHAYKTLDKYKIN